MNNRRARYLRRERILNAFAILALLAVSTLAAIVWPK